VGAVKCSDPTCKIDPEKKERRRTCLTDEPGGAIAWLVVDGPHASAYNLEAQILGELADVWGREPELLSPRRRR
jgi:hypothetical protein